MYEVISDLIGLILFGCLIYIGVAFLIEGIRDMLKKVGDDSMKIKVEATNEWEKKKVTKKK